MKEVKYTSIAYQCEICETVYGDPCEASQCEDDHLMEPPVLIPVNIKEVN